MSRSDTELVRSTARLARLEIGQEEADRLGEEFARILGAFRTLSELAVDEIEPMTGPTDTVDALRDDMAHPGLTADQTLANAPHRIDDFFSVPRTIGGEE